MHLTITPQGPWMVRGEEDTERKLWMPLKNPTGQIVLPASSLKGVLRSTAERILRTVDTNTDPKRIPLADAPFVHASDMSREQYQEWLQAHQRADIADSEMMEWHAVQEPPSYTAPQLEPGAIYTLLSAASQLFGCTLHAGLVMLDDTTVPARRLSPRTHVAIDRFTGGAAQGALFTEELVPPTLPLTTTLTITNFALWQIGLLALVFQEINRGYVGMGAGTRKGQGQMKIAVPAITFTYNAQAYRDSQKGIISAQARLAEPPWSVNDIPYAVQHTEGDKVLLSDIDPQTSQDWREQGRKILLVQEEQVTALFQEAVQHAWVPWVQQMMKQEVQ